MKKQNSVLWFFVLFASIIALCACSASKQEGGYLVNSSGDKVYLADDFILEINRAYELIKKYYVDEVDTQKLYEGALAGMVSGLEDPHSTYWDAETFESVQKELLRGDFGGVGLYINKANPKALTPESPITDYFVNVVAPIKGTPGYRADIHAGDFISHIDGESVAELTSDEAVARLTGKPGTEVLLTIVREGNIVFDVTIERAVIEVPTCEYAMIDNNIAYLQVISWTQHTSHAIEEAIKSFKEKNFKSLIIDLRQNGGGLLDAAGEIGNMFLSKGVIVSTKYKEGTDFQDQEIKANSYQTIVDDNIELVVLIDKGSASASEIFAGAIQDHKRGTIIGSTSYGKGSVQVPLNMKYGDSLKITVGKYYTPSGKNIHEVGITPDIEIEEEDFTDEEIEDFAKLVKEKYIDQFVAENPDQKLADAKIPAFLNKLQAEEIDLEDRLIRKLIRNKYHRKMDFPPVYDLEFDIVLQKAVEVLSK